MSYANGTAEGHGLETATKAEGASSALVGSRTPLRHEEISRFLVVSRTNIAIEPIASVLFAIGLWQYGDIRRIGIWLALIWALAVLRLLLNLHIQRTDLAEERLAEWGFAVSAVTTLAGGLWASGLLFLWPVGTEPLANALGFFLVVPIMAVAGIVVVTVAVHVLAVLPYLLVTGIVAAICLLWQPTASSALPVTLPLMGLIVAIVMLAALGWWVNSLHARQAQLSKELDAAHEAAKAAHLTKSEFVANISHELRTPLNAINGFSEIIKDQAFGPIDTPQYLEYANDIYESGGRLLEVINDILELSNLETGKMSFAEEWVDVRAVVHSVIDAALARADEAGVTLQEIASDRPIFLLADRQLLKQILSNLVSNAVKFTPLGGEVTVEVKFGPTGDLMMIVNDNGIGMSPEDIATAQTPFGQADASLARRFEGTGLGIPLVKSLVELHGGTFRLQSDLSVGTRAIAKFPANSIQK